MGREWFPLTFRNPEERWDGVNAAHAGFDTFLDAELARHQLPPSALALVGFSQGTMMSLHAGLRRAMPPAHPPARPSSYPSADPTGRTRRTDRLDREDVTRQAVSEPSELPVRHFRGRPPAGVAGGHLDQ